MNIQNKIKKRLGNINAFVRSKKKIKAEEIHQFRLEVKRLETFVELPLKTEVDNPSSMMPNRLENLYHVSGKVRKLSLEMDDVTCITKEKFLTKPKKYFHRLNSRKEKNIHKLIKKRKTFPVLRIKDLVKHGEGYLSSVHWRSFLTTCADEVSDLLKQDLLTDIHALHLLRKQLKSILYAGALIEKSSFVYSFLKSRKKWIKSVESKIGSLHDIDFFLRDLRKASFSERSEEFITMEIIKQNWIHHYKSMKDDLQILFPNIDQFANDLKEKLARPDIA